MPRLFGRCGLAGKWRVTGDRLRDNRWAGRVQKVRLGRADKNRRILERLLEGLLIEDRIGSMQLS